MIRNSLLLFILLSCFSLRAQQRKTFLTLSGGPNYQMIKDQHAAPFTYNVRGPQFKVGLEHRGEKSYWQLDLQAVIGQARPNNFKSMAFNLDWGKDFEGNPVVFHGSLEAPYYQAGLSFQYMRNVIKKERLSIWLGGGLEANMYYTELSRYFWPMAINGLTFSSKTTYQINTKHHLSGWLTFVPVALLSRFDYSSNPSLPDRTLVNAFFRKDTKVVFSNELVKKGVTLAYQYSLTPRIGVGVQYDFNWVSTRSPRPLQLYQNMYSFKTTIAL